MLTTLYKSINTDNAICLKCTKESELYFQIWQGSMCVESLGLRLGNARSAATTSGAKAIYVGHAKEE